MNQYFNNAPTFYRLIQPIFSKSSMQKKRILSHFRERECRFWQQAEEFAQNYLAFLDETGMTVEEAADTYLHMCKDMVVEQIKFARTGVYSCTSAAEVERIVYASSEIMTYHMHGMALSQFLWKNHYLMFRFFIDEIRKANNISNYLEVGAGHGLFLAEALKVFQKALFLVVDISQTSIMMTKKLIKHFSPHAEGVHFEHKDIMTFDTKIPFDFVVMGEVLEHVDEPFALLQKVHNLLQPHGLAYITTCCNYPAIDHVYLFRDVQEIHELLNESGLYISRELILSGEGVPDEGFKRQRIGINYAVIVQRSEV